MSRLRPASDTDEPDHPLVPGTETRSGAGDVNLCTFTTQRNMVGIFAFELRP